jgi:hypothetical protein
MSVLPTRTLDVDHLRPDAMPVTVPSPRRPLRPVTTTRTLDVDLPWPETMPVTDPSPRQPLHPVVPLRTLMDSSSRRTCIPSGHFGSGIDGGPTLIHSETRDSVPHNGMRVHTHDYHSLESRNRVRDNAHAAHMAGPAGARFRSSVHPRSHRSDTRPPPISPPRYTSPHFGRDSDF